MKASLSNGPLSCGLNVVTVTMPEALRSGKARRSLFFRKAE
jgi:hypothetical protein